MNRRLVAYSLPCDGHGSRIDRVSFITKVRHRLVYTSEYVDSLSIDDMK